MYELLRYLTMNRAGTRIGRATWVYFALWAIVLEANYILVHKLHLLSSSDTETASICFTFLSLGLLLLNRLDRSGPTLQEMQAAEKTRSAAQRARDLATRESTLAFRLGRWLRRRIG